MTWVTPEGDNASGNSFQVAIWDGLTHHYPHGGNDPLQNPNGFRAADTFWEFFELNEKPL